MYTFLVLLGFIATTLAVTAPEASTVTEMRKGRGAGECYEQCRSSYGSSDSLYSACSEGCNSYRCVNFGRNLKTPLEKKDVVVDPVTAIKKDLSPVTDIKKVPGITTKRPAVSVRPGAQDKVTIVKDKVPVV